MLSDPAVDRRRSSSPRPRRCRSTRPSSWPSGSAPRPTSSWPRSSSTGCCPSCSAGARRRCSSAARARRRSRRWPPRRLGTAQATRCSTRPSSRSRCAAPAPATSTRLRAELPAALPLLYVPVPVHPHPRRALDPGARRRARRRARVLTDGLRQPSAPPAVPVERRAGAPGQGGPASSSCSRPRRSSSPAARAGSARPPPRRPPPPWPRPTWAARCSCSPSTRPGAWPTPWASSGSATSRPVCPTRRSRAAGVEPQRRAVGGHARHQAVVGRPGPPPRARRRRPATPSSPTRSTRTSPASSCRATTTSPWSGSTRSTRRVATT